MELDDPSLSGRKSRDSRVYRLARRSGNGSAVPAKGSLMCQLKWSSPFRAATQATPDARRHRRGRTRCGSMLIYTVIIMVPLTGLCSLAVDFGRVEAAKTELLAASDAAARAGAFQLSPGSNSSTNYPNSASPATTIFSECPVDGQTLTLGSNGNSATVG